VCDISLSFVHPNSDRNYGNPFGLGALRLLCQLLQIPWIAREQDHWARLGHCDDGKESVECAAMSGQAGLAEQFASGPAILPVDPYDFDILQDVMQFRISRSTAQHLSECGSGGHDVPSVSPGNLKARSGQCVPVRQLGKPIGIEDERASYSSS
jgi:hypothetical protein